jgi:8-oxo-dGTP pyrophosphatase MutT (NUDIX family)
MILTHAGGVVHREDSGRVLLVRARPAPHDWVLPKGHIEPGERPEETAVREVAEEAGVVASVAARLGVLDFTKPTGEAARVLFFLMRFAGEVPPAERRAIGWWTIDEALALIPFANTRAILEAARRLLSNS